MSYSALPDTTLSSLPSVNASSTHLSILDLSWNLFTVSTSTLLHWFSNFSSYRLTFIALHGNDMPGPIPDVFENMISLQRLYLDETGLEGGVPKYFGNMSNLRVLALDWNNLTGELFEVMMNLSGPIEDKLHYLRLGGNKISGLIPNMSRFSSLEELSLGANRLNGPVQEAYLQLPSLRFLSLDSNQLRGPVPDLSFCSSLENLALSNNLFNEISPQSIGHLSKLEFLSIGSNLFEGTITEAHMSNLSKLQMLDLSSKTVKFSHDWVPPFQLELLILRNCSLGPDFPWWLQTQKQLRYIDISSTGISDIIPSWLGGITTKLSYMNASNNQLYGVSPGFSYSTINSSTRPEDRMSERSIALDLSRNKIGGSITFLCKMRDLKLLDLSDNHFSDHIPECFSNFKKLKFLNLANNHFFGEVPFWFGSLGALSVLQLRNNSFSGELPASMGNCTELEMIDLGENRLTGKIPTWMGDRFSQLKVLVLRFNEFIDSIPSNLCCLANIQILDISSNKVFGAVPNCIHKYVAMIQKEFNPWFIPDDVIVMSNRMYRYMEITSSLRNAYFMWKGNELKYTNNLGLVRLIDLSCNNLTGEIPSEITKLVGLVGLNLSTNNLIGSIPLDIGRLKSLEFLDFSRNHLSGHIPNSLGELDFLGVLNLSYNNLSGRIPPSNKLSTFDERSYLGNSGLCGLSLNKSCPGDQSHKDSNSNVDGNNEMSRGESEDGDDEFITQGFYIALGLGFIVGFWGIFGTILFNKEMQHTFFKVLNVVGDFVYVRMELSKARLLRHFQSR